VSLSLARGCRRGSGLDADEHGSESRSPGERAQRRGRSRPRGDAAASQSRESELGRCQSGRELKSAPRERRAVCVLVRPTRVLLRASRAPLRSSRSAGLCHRMQPAERLSHECEPAKRADAASCAVCSCDDSLFSPLTVPAARVTEREPPCHRADATETRGAGLIVY